MKLMPPQDLAPEKHVLCRVEIIRDLYGLRVDAFFGLDTVFSLAAYQLEKFIAPLVVHVQDISRNLYVIGPDQRVGLDLPVDVTFPGPGGM